MRLLLLPVAIALVSCPAGRQGEDSGSDQRITRVPGEPLVVQRLAPDATGTWRLGAALPCDSPRCLVSRSDVVGVRDGEHLWVRAAGDVDGRVVPMSPGTAEAAPGDALGWARAAAAGGAPEGPDSRPGGPPPLPPELRTCGTLAGGGGFGYHVIRNKGDVWQRIEWVVPPTASDMLALPPDAYPLVDGNGTVCGFGEQRRGERQWTVHQTRSGATLEAVRDREHVPASCGPDGAVLVETATGPMQLAADGTVGPGPPPTPVPTRVALNGKAVLHMSGGKVAVALPTGRLIHLDFADGRPLDGAAVPAGLMRDRVIIVGDGVRHLAVLERFVGPMSGLEVLNVLRVDGDAPQLIASPVRADVVITRLTHALDGFWWVEAPAVAMRLTE